MSRRRMKILVIGATGKQGGTVARLLLERDYIVYAFTRNPDSAAAQDLVDSGAEIVKGDLLDRKSLDKAVKNVDAVFSMSTPMDSGVDAEVKQGINVADSVKANGKYLVFTSVASADQNTGIPHFDSKDKIERHIIDNKIDAAIIAPVYFMENALTYMREQLRQGIYANALPPDRSLQQIALEDIGNFAVLALENPDRFIGTRTDIASDELTGEDCARILSDVTGKSFRYEEIPMEAVRKMSSDMAKMFEWFQEVGYNIDIQALRAKYPEVEWHTFEDWAREQDWELILGEKFASLQTAGRSK